MKSPHPPSYSCAEVDRSLWLYIDRELSASDLSAISAHLRQCPPCSALYLERAKEARSYRLAFADSPFGDRFAVKLRRKMAEEGLLNADAPPAPTAPPPPSSLRSPRGSAAASSRLEAPSGKLGQLLYLIHRGRAHRLLTVAAMLLLIPAVVAIGIISNGPVPRSLGVLSASGGTITVRYLRRIEGNPPLLGPSEPVPSTGAILSGMECVVPAGASAILNLVSESDKKSADITLDGPTSFVVDLHATRKVFSGRLERGDLRARVEPKGGDERFEIRTPHADARVVGTVFDLHVEDQKTELEVREGTVEFTPRGRGEKAYVTQQTGPYVARKNETGVEPVPAAPEATPPIVGPEAVQAVTPPVVQGAPSPEVETGAAGPDAAPSVPSPEVSPSPPDLDLPKDEADSASEE
jgi:hypothetical protein